MLLFCFPLPSVIISAAALAALPGKSSCYLSTAVHGLSVDTAPRNDRVGKGGQEHPTSYLALWQGDPNPRMVLHAWLITHPLSVNIHLCKNQPTQPNPPAGQKQEESTGSAGDGSRGVNVTLWWQ